MTQLLLISIGPVQDFIKSSRKCQDLWFGSWLLSYLSKVVAENLQAVLGDDALIFPGSIQGEQQAVANKILARISASAETPLGEISAVANQALGAMRKALRTLAEREFMSVVEGGGEGSADLFNRELALDHVTQMMECFWATVPIVDGDYGAARNQVEALLAARKNTNTWAPIVGRAGVPKSSIDGARESVLLEKLYSPDSPAKQVLRRRFQVKRDERLCGIGLLKRLGAALPSAEASSQRTSRPRFLSNSHIASAPFRAALRVNPKTREARDRYVKWLESEIDMSKYRVPQRNGDDRLRYDGYLLYEGRLADIYEEAAHNKPDGDERAADQQAWVEQARRKLRKFLCAADLGVPTPYYALLVADGDYMGQLIGAIGKHSDHQALSAALDAFAGSCRETVEKFDGSLIFAGGDDVMALLPLHTALRAAQALHASFETAMMKVAAVQNAIARTPASGTRLNPPSLSVGLALCHHVSSMAEARDAARRAERLAKAQPTKNALAIVAVKRGGEERQIVMSWNEEPVKRMEAWIEHFRKEELPDSVAFDLHDLASELRFTWGSGPRAAELAEGPSNQLLASLVGALLARKRAGRGTQAISETLQRELRRLTRAVDTAGATPVGMPGVDAVQQLAVELQIARIFLDAYKVAPGREANQ